MGPRLSGLVWCVCVCLASTFTLSFTPLFSHICLYYLWCLSSPFREAAAFSSSHIIVFVENWFGNVIFFIFDPHHWFLIVFLPIFSTFPTRTVIYFTYLDTTCCILYLKVIYWLYLFFSLYTIKKRLHDTICNECEVVLLWGVALVSQWSLWEASTHGVSIIIFIGCTVYFISPRFLLVSDFVVFHFIDQKCVYIYCFSMSLLSYLIVILVTISTPPSLISFYLIVSLSSISPQSLHLCLITSPLIALPSLYFFAPLTLVSPHTSLPMSCIIKLVSFICYIVIHSLWFTDRNLVSQGIK